jgi:hypothetical protein
MFSIPLRGAVSRGCLAVLLLASANASALTVTASAIDVPDVTADDLWSYRFDVSGVLATFESVRIAFDPTVHRPLGAQPVDGWFADTDPGQVIPFPADGYVLFSPVSDGISTPQSFVVEVVRLTAGPLPPQSFEVLDAGFDTVATGFTTPAPIPEPAAGWLCAAGLGLLGWRVRNRMSQGRRST